MTAIVAALMLFAGAAAEAASRSGRGELRLERIASDTLRILSQSVELPQKGQIYAMPKFFVSGDILERCP